MKLNNMVMVFILGLVGVVCVLSFTQPNTQTLPYEEAYSDMDMEYDYSTEESSGLLGTAAIAAGTGYLASTLRNNTNKKSKVLKLHKKKSYKKPKVYKVRRYKRK